MHRALVRYHRSFDNLVVEVDGEVPLGTTGVRSHGLEELRDVVREERRRLPREPARQIRISDVRDTLAVHVQLTWLGRLYVTTRLGSQVHDDRAWLHRVHHLLGDQPRRGFAWDECGGDDHIHLLRLLGEQLHFRLDEVGAHLLRVPTGSLLKLESWHFEELATHRAHLLADCRPCIEAPHDRAKSTRRSNGAETRDAAADDEHLGGWNASRGGDLPGEEARQVVGGKHDRLVSRDICHGAESVESLRPRDAWNAVECYGCDVLLVECVEQLRVRRGL